MPRSTLVRSHWISWGRLPRDGATSKVRNRATLGGNLGRLPRPDSAPALLVLRRRAVKGPEGDRSIPVDEFFAGPKRNALKKGELIVGILIPNPAGSVGVYESSAPQSR